jgi:hypothetical protein
MFELIIVGAFALYILLSIGAVLLAGWWAKKRGRRRWPWCTAVGVILYLVAAWELIPTYVVAEYYCRQAGLVVYKTPDQWRAENPGVAETLTWESPSPKIQEGQWKGCKQLNERFVSCPHGREFWPLPVHVIEDKIVDTLSGEVMVHSSYVYAGYSLTKNILRFYVGERRCPPKDGTGFPTAEMVFRKIEKKIDPSYNCRYNTGCREVFKQFGWRFDQ